MWEKDKIWTRVEEWDKYPTDLDSWNTLEEKSPSKLVTRIKSLVLLLERYADEYSPLYAESMKDDKELDDDELK